MAEKRKVPKRQDAPERAGDPEKMDTRYLEWILANVAGYSEAYGKCKETAHAMATMFEELRVARGHYHDPVWGERAHWWCETKDGVIVDPTYVQFPSKGRGGYVEFIGTDDQLPTGKCPNCGGECFNGDSICSDFCARDYLAYLNEDQRDFDRDE